MEKIKATRMEYLRLKKRQKTAQRGWKLLKDKRDGLMKKFMEIIREAKRSRQELEIQLKTASLSFACSTSALMQRELEEFFVLPSCSVAIDASKENIMSVWIPKFQYRVEGDFKSFSDLSAPVGMEDSIKSYFSALDLMVGLAEIEHSARLLSFEIEKTRRRVNALEYVIVPQIKKNIKMISSKLEEQERSEKIVRMKIKEMIG